MRRREQDQIHAVEDEEPNVEAEQGHEPGEARETRGSLTNRQLLETSVQELEKSVGAFAEGSPDRLMAEHALASLKYALKTEGKKGAPEGKYRLEIEGQDGQPAFEQDEGAPVDELINVLKKRAENIRKETTVLKVSELNSKVAALEYQREKESTLYNKLEVAKELDATKSEHLKVKKELDKGFPTAKRLDELTKELSERSHAYFEAHLSEKSPDKDLWTKKEREQFDARVRHEAKLVSGDYRKTGSPEGDYFAAEQIMKHRRELDLSEPAVEAAEPEPVAVPAGAEARTSVESGPLPELTFEIAKVKADFLVAAASDAQKSDAEVLEAARGVGDLDKKYRVGEEVNDQIIEYLEAVSLPARGRIEAALDKIYDERVVQAAEESIARSETPDTAHAAMRAREAQEEAELEGDEDDEEVPEPDANETAGSAEPDLSQVIESNNPEPAPQEEAPSEPSSAEADDDGDTEPEQAGQAPQAQRAAGPSRMERARAALKATAEKAKKAFNRAGSALKRPEKVGAALQTKAEARPEAGEEKPQSKRAQSESRANELRESLAAETNQRVFFEKIPGQANAEQQARVINEFRKALGMLPDSPGNPVREMALNKVNRSREDKRQGLILAFPSNNGLCRFDKQDRLLLPPNVSAENIKKLLLEKFGPIQRPNRPNKGARQENRRPIAA